MKRSLCSLFVLLLTSYSCTLDPQSKELDSDDFSTANERITVLMREIVSHSDITKAEFELFNVNGFSNSSVSIPGASYWDYKMALQVPLAEVGQWTNGMTKVATLKNDLEWITQIIEQRKKEWKTNSPPEFFIEEGAKTIAVVYKEEGIVFKRILRD
ncbi:MAG: hypothetical protein ACRBFS_10645 [Aureispira sp.]